LSLPKIFHYVWIGGTPLPDKDRAWTEEWVKNHLDWECILWSDRAQKKGLFSEVRRIPKLINQGVYDDMEQWSPGRAAIAARSDIVRYEVVALEGGVYLDTDVNCFKRIDPILDGVKLFCSDERAIEPEWASCPGNYMFGAEKGSPAMWTVVRELTGNLREIKGKVNPVIATGPRYLQKQLAKYNSDLILFPYVFFNPLNPQYDPDKVEVWPEMSLGNHRFDGKWYEREKKVPPKEFLKNG
jgi:mannosyltransferase OCH1-like enzyme